jgi:hypothetical protein
MKSFFLLLSAVSIAALFTGCNPSSQTGLHSTEVSQWVGKNVRVELRRDAAVASSLNPVAGVTNGAATTIVGKLIKVHSVSIVVGDEQRPKWIPREVILFVELNP